MDGLKKESLYLLGILLIVFSGLSEVVISMTKEKQWNNYVHSWNVPLKDQSKATVKKSAAVKKTVTSPARSVRQECEY